MLYNEFVEGTGCKDTEKNYKIYKDLEIMYMNSDMTKQEIYEYGKKLVDNSKTAAEIEAEEKVKEEIEELKREVKRYETRIVSLKESIENEQEFLRNEMDDGWKKYHKTNISWWKEELRQKRKHVMICKAKIRTLKQMFA